MDQVIQYQKLLISYFSKLMEGTILLLILYEFFLFTQSHNPFIQSLAIPPFLILFVSSLILLLIIGIPSVLNIFRFKILLNVNILPKYTKLPKNFSLKLSSVIAIIHIIALSFYVLVLVFLPVNTVSIIILLIMFVLTPYVDMKSSSKKIIENYYPNCIHCETQLINETDDKPKNAMLDHCFLCTEAEDEIARFNTIYIVYLPLILNIAFYSVVFLGSPIYSYVQTSQGLNLIFFELLYGIIAGIELILLVSIFLVYPILFINNSRKLKKKENFVIINKTKKNKRDTLTVRQNSYFMFGMIYFLMIFPVIGLVFIIIIDVVNYFTNILQAVPARELFMGNKSNHHCHLQSPKVYITY